MFRKSLLIVGLLIATISVSGKPLFRHITNIHEQEPKSTIVEDEEVACGDSAEAHRIVISKESMSLKLYDRDDQLICSFPVSLGRNYGDKQELGDRKTPEGDFSIVQIQRASHWMYNSGKESIKGYYGNWFIRLNTKYSSIGIHGTHEPEQIGERTTEGSIRLNNYHLDSLRMMIDVGMAVRIESSHLDRESDGKNAPEVEMPTIVADTAQPIINNSATPVIEEHTSNTTVVTTENPTTPEREVVESDNTPTTVERPTNDNEEWYTVKDGDLVGRIAMDHGISVSDIKRLNPNLNVDRISIGQRIKVKGEMVAIEEGQPKPTPVEEESNSGEVWHTVADGDLVGRIASQYGTTTRRIQELNPNLNPDRISIGQRIRVK